MPIVDVVGATTFEQLARDLSDRDVTIANRLELFFFPILAALTGSLQLGTGSRIEDAFGSLSPGGAHVCCTRFLLLVAVLAGLTIFCVTADDTYCGHRSLKVVSRSGKKSRLRMRTRGCVRTLSMGFSPVNIHITCLKMHYC